MVHFANQAPVAADRMDETECVLPAKLRSKARRALSAGGAVSGASSDLAGGSSDDNETPRPPPPAVALFEQVRPSGSHPYGRRPDFCTCSARQCPVFALLHWFPVDTVSSLLTCWLRQSVR